MREPPDRRRRNARERRHPLGREGVQPLADPAPPFREGVDRRVVDAPVGDQDVHHGEQERGVAPGADRHVLVGLARRLGAPRIDDHDAAAARADARAGGPCTFGAVRKLPFDTHGLAPMQRR